MSNIEYYDIQYAAGRTIKDHSTSCTPCGRKVFLLFKREFLKISDENV